MTDLDKKLPTWMMRIETYREHKWPIEASQDKDWVVRLEYFKARGYTEEALNDENVCIRTEAKRYLLAAMYNYMNLS